MNAFIKNCYISFLHFTEMFRCLRHNYLRRSRGRFRNRKDCTSDLPRITSRNSCYQMYPEIHTSSVVSDTSFHRLPAAAAASDTAYSEDQAGQPPWHAPVPSRYCPVPNLQKHSKYHKALWFAIPSRTFSASLKCPLLI